MKKILIISFLLSLFVASCISLKDDYPAINFYRLNQEPGDYENIGFGSIKGTLQVRQFSASDEVDTDHFLAVWGDTRIQRYYYHRWIANCADLVSDFIIIRYNNIRVFSGGTVKPGSLIIPDYILDGQVLDMVAHNSESSEKGKNYVYLSLRISLLKKVSLKTEKSILLNKVFTVKVSRKDNLVSSIAPAFSKALTQISDKMLVELREEITKDRAEK